MNQLLDNAIKERADFIEKHLAFESILEKYKGKTGELALPRSVLKEHKVGLPSPCKVLRIVTRGKAKQMLIPATPTMRIVLRHDLNDGLTIKEFKKLEGIRALDEMSSDVPLEKSD